MFGAPNANGWVQLGLLALALVAGAAIGFERELRRKDAGMRTHALISVGAALFVLVSKFGFHDVPRPAGDPGSVSSGGSNRHRSRLHRCRAHLHTPRRRARAHDRGLGLGQRGDRRRVRSATCGAGPHHRRPLRGDERTNPLSGETVEASGRGGSSQEWQLRSKNKRHERTLRRPARPKALALGALGSRKRRE